MVKVLLHLLSLVLFLTQNITKSVILKWVLWIIKCEIQYLALLKLVGLWNSSNLPFFFLFFPLQIKGRKEKVEEGKKGMGGGGKEKKKKEEEEKKERKKLLEHGTKVWL